MLYTQAQTLRLGDSVYTAKNSAIDRSHQSLNFKIYIVSKIKTEAPFWNKQLNWSQIGSCLRNEKYMFDWLHLKIWFRVFVRTKCVGFSQWIKKIPFTNFLNVRTLTKYWPIRLELILQKLTIYDKNMQFITRDRIKMNF